MPSKSRSVIPPQITNVHAPQRHFRALGRFYKIRRFSTKWLQNLGFKEQKPIFARR